MTTQVLASLAPFSWADRLLSRLSTQPLTPAQRDSLARSAQAQSLTAAVRSLTSTVGYAAMPCFTDAGPLSVHPRAGVVTTPGGFRVSFRHSQVRLQSPDGLWSEFEAEPPTRSTGWRHPLTEQRLHLLLPDGTRLTLLQGQESRRFRRVVISHGNNQLAADSALSGPVWQPVQHGAQSALSHAPREGERYEAMIDDGRSPRPPQEVRATNKLAALAALFLEQYAAAPQHWDRLQETFRARQSQPHLPVMTTVGDLDRLQSLSGGPVGAAALWGPEAPFDLPSRFAQMNNAVSELLLLLLNPGPTATGDPPHEPDADPAPAPAAASPGGSPVSGCTDARLPPGRSGARGSLRVVP